MTVNVISTVANFVSETEKSVSKGFLDFTSFRSK